MNHLSQSRRVTWIMSPAQGLTEYGLVLGMASLAAVVALTLFGGNLAGSIANALGAVVSNFPSP
jgi:hypothetical protein